MAVSSITTTKRWQCVAPRANGDICGTIFDDPTSLQPCPACGNADDNTIEPYAPSGAAAVGTVKKVPKAKAEAAPTGRAPIIGLFALLFGTPAWLEGARLTRDGWIFGINWILGRAGLPFQVPHASAWVWWAAIVAMVVLGWAYSRVELRWVPIRLPKNLRRDFFDPTAWYINRSATVWFVWLLVLFTDVVTTFLGVGRAGDPVLLQQIAASMTIAWIYAIIITFVPDRLIRFGWRSIRG